MLLILKEASKSNEKLISYQRNADTVPLKLVKDVETKWNSNLYMLQRFILLVEAIKSTMALIEKKAKIPTKNYPKRMALNEKFINYIETI